MMTEHEARKKMRTLKNPVVGKLRQDPRIKRHPIFQEIVGKRLQIFGVTSDSENGPLLWFKPQEGRLKGTEMSLLAHFFDFSTIPIPLSALF